MAAPDVHENFGFDFRDLSSLRWRNLEFGKTESETFTGDDGQTHLFTSIVGMSVDVAPIKHAWKNQMKSQWMDTGKKNELKWRY